MSETKIIRKGRPHVKQKLDIDDNCLLLEIIDITCEFLETWIHQILFQWKLYPIEVFQVMKKFKVTVRVATYPQVQTYISTFIQSCHVLLEKGELKSIALTVLEDTEPIEKLVFEALPSFRREDGITMDMILDSISVYTLADLEQHLRAALLQLVSYPSVNELKENRSFHLSIETTEEGSAPPELDWIPANLHYNWEKMTPLKSQHMDIFRFNTFIMEASRKGKGKST